MLQQETLKEAEHTNASPRVTPQELAEAVAALEARREAERAHQAETVSIADALHHLGLDTPEADVLSEVETLRKQRAHKARLERRARTRLRLFFAMFATVTLLVIAALGVMNFRLRHSLKNATLPFTTLPTQLLSQVPEGRLVHCDSTTLTNLADGTLTPNQVSVDVRPFTSTISTDQQFLNEWAITKKGGQILVTAWAGADQALIVQNNQQGFVYSNRPPWLSATNVVPVQLPAYRFANSFQMNYLGTGETIKTGPGVTQSLSVSPHADAVQALVKRYISSAEKGRRKEGELGDAYFTRVDVKPDGVHLMEDAVGDPAYIARATHLAQEALQRVNIPLSVINDMKPNKAAAR